MERMPAHDDSVRIPAGAVLDRTISAQPPECLTPQIARMTTMHSTCATAISVKVVKPLKVRSCSA